MPLADASLTSQRALCRAGYTINHCNSTSKAYIHSIVNEGMMKRTDLINRMVIAFQFSEHSRPDQLHMYKAMKYVLEQIETHVRIQSIEYRNLED